MLTDCLKFVGVLEGHTDWVTSVKTYNVDSGVNPTTLVLSTSRDKRVMVWKCEQDEMNPNSAGRAIRALTGHSQPVQDLCISMNGKYGITASWDKTLRLWDLEHGTTLRTFFGHQSDVFSVALSPDNRQIVSGSRDGTIRLWNTVAQCKFIIENDRHTDWVSCVRFSPTHTEGETLIVSCGWDKVVKVWDLQSCVLKYNLTDHQSALHSITISPDGSLCASGGKDGVAMLWDVHEGNHLYSLEAGSGINALCFSPCDYWLCAAARDCIKIWNLEDKRVIGQLTVPPAFEKTKAKTNSKRPARGAGVPWCVSLAWSCDGQKLLAGSTDGRIYVYEIPLN